jgi:predicted GNAT family N-acyltransferase
MEVIQAVSPRQIEDAKFVRTAVFQKEQGIDRMADFDGQDDKALHFVVYEGQPIGAARARLLDEGQKAKIERVAVLPSHRGKGIGKQILRFVEDRLKMLNVKEAILDSQEQAKGFYETLGYTQHGSVFTEVGIAHITMIKRFM